MRKTANQIADEAILKCAEGSITDEEIARGVAGRRLREGISEQDVADRAQGEYDTTYRGGRKAPFIGGGVGAGIGGLVGAGAGGAGGAAIGAGIGAGAGAGLGQLLRRGAASQAKHYGQVTGDIARRGRIPYDIDEGTLQELLEQYTREAQSDLVEKVSPEEYEAEASRRGRQEALRGGVQGALSGAAIGSLGSDSSIGDIVIGSLLGSGVGAAGGLAEGRRIAGQQADLRERGYGHAAEALQRNNRYY